MASFYHNRNQKIDYALVRRLLEEECAHFGMLTDYAGQMDMDYADYVSYAALEEFRQALGQGDLTPGELSILLRRARQYVLRTQAKTRHHEGWAEFMASYMADSANENGRWH